MSDSIHKTWNIDLPDQGKRLDLYLVDKYPKLSRTQIQQLIDDSRVKVNGQIRKAHTKIQAGQKVDIEIPVPRKIDLLPEDIPLDVLYEDDDILVINKQPGLVVHPAPGHLEHTLVNAILNYCQNLANNEDPMRPGIVHRLDKDTSGCLLVAKNDISLRKLGIQFEKRVIMKQYLSLVWGRMESFKGELELSIGRHPTDRKKMAVTRTGKPAHTTFEVIERFQQATLVKIFLRTGRTHQIRVHMSYLGHPVLGDSEYGRKGMELAKTLGLSRQMLHAALLGIRHPRSDQWMMFSAPMPLDMNMAVEQLKKNSKE